MSKSKVFPWVSILVVLILPLIYLWVFSPGDQQLWLDNLLHFGHFKLIISMLVGSFIFQWLKMKLLVGWDIDWLHSIGVTILWNLLRLISPFGILHLFLGITLLNRSGLPFGKATAVHINYFLSSKLVILFILFGLFGTPQGEYIAETLTDAGVFAYFVIWVVLLILHTALLAAFVIRPTLFKSFLRFSFKILFLKRWLFIADEWGKDVHLYMTKFRFLPLTGATFLEIGRSYCLSIGLVLVVIAVNAMSLDDINLEIAQNSLQFPWKIRKAFFQDGPVFWTLGNAHFFIVLFVWSLSVIYIPIWALRNR